MINPVKTATQARGRARRHLLLEAARALLQDVGLHDLELSTVAARAGNPKSSACHFYGDIHQLYSDLAGQLDEELNAVLDAKLVALADWQLVEPRGRRGSWPCL